MTRSLIAVGLVAVLAAACSKPEKKSEPAPEAAKPVASVQAAQPEEKVEDATVQTAGEPETKIADGEIPTSEDYEEEASN
jgi:nitrous oxide reductase accessory protein NosL